MPIPHTSKSRLRVLMLANYFPKPLNPLMGNWALAQALALSRADIEIEVVSFSAWVPIPLAFTAGAKAYATCPRSTTYDGLRVHYPRWPVYPVGPMRRWSERHPEPFLRIGWNFARPWLKRYVDHFRPQLIYAHHTAANGYLAWQLHRTHGLPFVVTDHDFDEIRSCERWPDRKRLFDQITHSSSMMVAVASSMEEDLTRLFPRARTTTVHNGTESIPDSIRTIPKPNMLHGKVVLFSCGVFYERKGFPLLIEAYSRIAARYPHSVLRIAGDGVQRQEVLSQIRRHSLDKQVVLLGPLSHDDVLKEMLWSDAFVLIGWDEPFATVFSEAASAGLPIICCNDGGFSDVLQDGIHGILVPPKDVDAASIALERLIRDDMLRARMAQSAKTLFDHELHWNHNASKMRHIFIDSINRHSATTRC